MNPETAKKWKKRAATGAKQAGKIARRGAANAVPAAKTGGRLATKGAREVHRGRTVVLSIAALSFLGLGESPPAAEWGSMLNDGRVYFRLHPHLMVLPGVCIFLYFNLHGCCC